MRRTDSRELLQELACEQWATEHELSERRIVESEGSGCCVPSTVYSEAFHASCSAHGCVSTTLKSPHPPQTTRRTSIAGRAFSLGRYSWRRASHALSEAEPAGPPSASMLYLQRHSRETCSKLTAEGPMVGILVVSEACDAEQGWYFTTQVHGRTVFNS